MRPVDDSTMVVAFTMATTSSKSSGSSDEDLLDDFFAALEIDDDKAWKKNVLKIDKSDRDTSSVTGIADEFGQRDGTCNNDDDDETEQQDALARQSETEASDRPRTVIPSEKTKASKAAENTGKEKYNYIHRAESVKASWTEFQICNNAGDSERGKEGSKGAAAAPISFSLKQAKGKKKKKKMTKDSSSSKKRHDNYAEAAEQVSEKRENTNGGTLQQRPRWTAVIDTCCLLDDGGDAIREIIRLAKSSQYIKDADPTYALNAASLDEIQLVIPHVVWSELDGISKRAQGRRFRSDNHDGGPIDEAEELSRRARGATRMLREEMEVEAAAFRRGHLLDGGYKRQVLKSQTMLEMKAASRKYLSSSTANEVVNDDHILACALTEASKSTADDDQVDTSPTSVAAVAVAGGSVLLTNDHNLACKAIANGVRVFCPMEFCKHISLRSEVRKDMLREQRGL
mmetsp:Transcript_26441/g.57300  ORF Transcript_26441/g.57300 Transcript_26441/m.57300 type:complete len:457 (+) Transcript_26441:10-1380(+)